MQDFKKLLVWQKAHEHVLNVFTICKCIPLDEKYFLGSQIKRATISIAANIAEGCGKRTNKDFVNFLHISLGSLHESEYYIVLLKDLGYLSKVDFEIDIEKINQLKAMLLNLINKINNSTNV